MKLFFRKMGAGTPVIVLHGLLGSSDNWLTIGKQLAETHAVYLLDMRNHGRSPHSSEFNYVVMAADVNEFMLDHEIRGAILIGHSMGGKIAMNLAMDYPHKIQKLVVVDIAPKVYSSPYFKDIIRTLLNLNLAEVTSRREVDRQIAPQIPETVLRKFILKYLVRDKENRFKWKVNLPALYENADAIAGEILREDSFPNPALFIRGGNTDYISEEDLPGIKSKFPRAEVVTVPGAGHWVHIEAPEVFLQRVREFICL